MIFSDCLVIRDIVVYLRSCHNQSKLSKKLQTRWRRAYDIISSFIDAYLDLNGIISDESCKSILAGIDFHGKLTFAKYLKHFVDVAELMNERLIKLSKPYSNDPDSIIKLKKTCQCSPFGAKMWNSQNI
jgi:hypothetical protein